MLEVKKAMNVVISERDLTPPGSISDVEFDLEGSPLAYIVHMCGGLIRLLDASSNRMISAQNLRSQIIPVSRLRLCKC